MRTISRWGSQLLLLVLSLIGVGIAIYLTSVHYENVPLICSTSGLIDCARVLSSSYSVVPGTAIPITIPGISWSLSIAALAIAAIRVWPEQRWVRVAQFVLALLGLLSVFYLVYVELVRLHTICLWCTVLHIIILAIFITTAVQLQQPEYEPETGKQ